MMEVRALAWIGGRPLEEVEAAWPLLLLRRRRRRRRRLPWSTNPDERRANVSVPMTAAPGCVHPEMDNSNSSVEGELLNGGRGSLKKS